MKNSTQLITFVFFLITTNIIAQNTFPSSGTARIVGANLEVKDGSIYVNKTDASSGNYQIAFRGTSALFGYDADGSTIGANGAYMASGDTSKPFYIAPGKNILYTFGANGRMGVGITNPTAKLEVKDGDVKINGGGLEVKEGNIAINKAVSAGNYEISFRNGSSSFGFDADGTTIGKNGAYIKTADTGKALYIAQGDNIGYAFQGGNLGVGTSSPNAKLDIHGANSNTTNLILSANYMFHYRWRFNTIDRGNAIDLDFTASDANDEQETVLKLSRSTSGRPEFQLHNNTIVANNGNVGIGTANTGSWKLAVNGKIRAKEIKVETGWSDFVFYDDYKLPTLKEVEEHIKEEGHLKDIPSAKEVKENGIYLGEMDAKLLQKIEELTLYTIQQQKQIAAQKEKLKKLEKENERFKLLENRMAEIEKLLKE